MDTIHEAFPVTRAREFREGVTFHDFRVMAQREHWTVDGILDALAADGIRFGGPRSSPYYEKPRLYLERVLRRGHTIDAAHVIPYRSLIALYVDACRRLPVTVRRCACGCGSPLFPAHRAAAADSCRARLRSPVVPPPVLRSASRPCACGCGVPLGGRRLYASNACRQRDYRERRLRTVWDPAKRPAKG